MRYWNRFIAVSRIVREQAAKAEGSALVAMGGVKACAGGLAPRALRLSRANGRGLGQPALAQIRGDAVGPVLALDRAKTGKAAAATLPRWSQAVLATYLRKFGAELLDTGPLFWTRGGRPVSRDGATGRSGGDHGGGRHIQPRRYTKSSLNQDFRAVRVLAFGKDEKRQLQDMRRSGRLKETLAGLR